MATWKELKAQGVIRCCAMFRNGKQCRRRAAEGSSWCDKHGPVIEAKVDYFMALAREGEALMAAEAEEDEE